MANYTGIPLSSFIPWLEEKLSQKYSDALEGMHKRFIGIFSLLRIILNYTIEINEIFQKSPELLNKKQFLDNILHILNEIILEYPKVLDFEYCENFISTIQERLELIYANFHPLTHISVQEISINSAIEAKCRIISSALQKAPNFIIELQNRAELALPLLKHIEQSLKYFKDPVNLLINEISQLKEFEKIKNDFLMLKMQVSRFPKDEEHKSLKKMGELALSFSEVEKDLEAYLEPAIKMSHMIKNKGKKFLREEGKEDCRDLLSYVSILVKQDFFSHLLPDLCNTDDLIQALLHLQSQRGLIGELRKKEPYKSGFESISIIKADELRDLLAKWKQLYKEIKDLEASEEFSENFQAFKNNTLIPFTDLGNLLEKLRQFQRVFHVYQKSWIWFKKLRYKVARFCLEEFHERIELAWTN